MIFYHLPPEVLPLFEYIDRELERFKNSRVIYITNVHVM